MRRNRVLVLRQRVKKKKKKGPVIAFSCFIEKTQNILLVWRVTTVFKAEH